MCGFRPCASVESKAAKSAKLGTPENTALRTVNNSGLKNVSDIKSAAKTQRGLSHRESVAGNTGSGLGRKH